MKYVLLSIAMVAFAGCSSEEKGIFKNDIKTIPVSFSTTKELVFTNDLIDSIHYIKLEDTEESIGEVNKMIVEDGKIIIWDNARKCIWTFTDKGKLIGRISHLGNGPQKYATIYNISFAKPDRIFIIDGIARSINTYTTRGDFVEKAPIQGNVSDFLSSGNITYSFYYYRFRKKNNYLSVKENDDTKVGFYKYVRPFLFIGNGGDMLVKRGEEVFLRQPYNDTLFSYKNKTLTARYVFDFGQNRYPTAALYAAGDLSQADTIIARQPREGNVSNLILSNAHMVLTYNQQNKTGQLQTAVMVRNLVTDSTITYRYLGGINHQVVPNYPLATDGEQFYSLYTSPELPQQFKKSGADSVRYGINSNPIIVQYRYKL